jgi:hypothetical protein
MTERNPILFRLGFGGQIKTLCLAQVFGCEDDAPEALSEHIVFRLLNEALVTGLRTLVILHLLLL